MEWKFPFGLFFRLYLRVFHFPPLLRLPEPVQRNNNHIVVQCNQSDMPQKTISGWFWKGIFYCVAWEKFLKM